MEGRFVTFPTVLIVLGMRWLLFTHAEPVDIESPGAGYVWRFLAPLFTHPYVSFVVSTLAVLTIAWLIRSMNNRFALLRTRSNLPFIIPLLLLSLHPIFLVMGPYLAAVIPVVFAFMPLLQSYQKEDAYLYSFRTGILIAVASLFHIGALALVPLWLRGEQTMRGPQPRALLTFLFGFMLVAFSALSVAFLLDDIPAFLSPFHLYASISMPLLPEFTVFEWIGLLLVLLFFISNLTLSTRVFSRDKVLTVILMRFVVYLIVFLLLLQLLYWRQTLFFITLALALVSYLHAYYFTRANVKGVDWLAYVNLFVMLLFYLSHFNPFSRFII